MLTSQLNTFWKSLYKRKILNTNNIIGLFAMLGNKESFLRFYSFCTSSLKFLSDVINNRSTGNIGRPYRVHTKSKAIWSFGISLLMLFFSIPIASAQEKITTKDNALIGPQAATIKPIEQEIRNLLALSKSQLEIHLEDAVRNAQLAEQLYIQEGEIDPELQLHIYIVNGVAYFIRDNMRISTEYYIKALKLAQDLGNKRYEIYMWVNIGNNLLLIHDYEISRSLFLSALSEFRELKPPLLSDSDLMKLYNSLAICYEKIKQTDSAAYYFELAMEKEDPGARDLYTYQVRINHLNFLYQNQLGGSEVMDSMERLFLKRDSLPAHARLFLSLYLGNAYKLASEFSKAKNRYLYSYQESLRLQVVSAQVENTSMLAKMYARLQMPDSSVYYASLSDSLSPKLEKEKVYSRLIKDQVFIKLFDKESEGTLKKGTTFRARFFGLLVFVTLFVVYLAVFQYKKLRKARDLLVQSQSKVGLIRTQKRNLEKKAEVLTQNVQDQSKQILDSQLVIEKMVKTFKANSKKPTDTELRELILYIQQLKDSALIQESAFALGSSQHTFIKKLNAAIPSITPLEQKVCMLLYANMTSKEIASYTRQSIRGVELTRIRLRKKLGLTGTDTSLHAYLLSL